ncbi:DUF3465 domain-containing protein [Acinetobacter celticus]|uniref:DUF3465 domain-containing protein n=1 Tax=Acinetobacter celticus TaxID=1891224 RepID=A0A1C3CWS4_9GAMM|nr:DUF3465 domain-containing protein [Acinetobacter celticus]ODA13244.1 hypothetical protein BBP83_07310 [Acinetobacter celticus]
MANKANIGIGVVITLLIAVYFGIDLQSNKVENASSYDVAVQQNKPSTKNSATDHSISSVKDDTAKIAQAFAQQQSNVQVHTSGQVKAILRDDNEGLRHQMFILKLQNGQTVLVAHNIDLSPRIQSLQKGDTVEFYGEYEYSQQGGVIHWTHLDPNKRHIDGWLKHNGQIYQ